MSIFLDDIPQPRLDAGFDTFSRLPIVESLNWPAEVVRQFLFDHRDYFAMSGDYDFLPLERIAWALEEVSTDALRLAATGPSEGDLLDYNASKHVYLLGIRSAAIQNQWGTRGTWIVPPLLLAGDLMTAGEKGYQVLEGRTRVGILRGRANAGLKVSSTHHVWVGRPR